VTPSVATLGDTNTSDATECSLYIRSITLLSDGKSFFMTRVLGPHST